ncbi:amino acid ABC transporter permease [Helcobacillus massiliensis]|uniref:amino acid ABC transporter permease n=1 Tax=Helcobacillus TaxID=1161125 RepID=UPI001EF463A4|nr:MULTISPECIES: amino acid ABC transporter permease [Helcobacillus]MCG7426708.1 amino acid ABC transporter permease [Helcobacillus sp. ACRRO]MCT1557669.1 amino acid ABC transporter permease [Helcobacillus massiliensis]MCT2035941.1 amino acid ABC transporter permease [Helcobacillus massiliensis]MCT2331789.1 amino acid ABC transporter permease [Helcobacillus massiliensis]MDK7742409.1 amino acid ABC transporter permease [Helcobacillus massiliensis]
MTTPEQAPADRAGTADAIPGRIRAREAARPGTWIAAVIVALIAAGLINFLITNPVFEWGIVVQYILDVKIIQGVGWTLLLTFTSMLLGTVVALIAAVMRRSDNPVLRLVSWVYIFVFRGTPVYTQLVFWGLFTVIVPKIAVGVPFGPELFSFSTRDYFTGFLAAVLGLGLNEGAYLAEIVRAGLGSVNRGQTEASKALGMSNSLILRRIIVPQAMRVIIPPLGNETIGMLKTTSLVLAVPFTLDLTFASNSISTMLFKPIPLLIVAALWYLAVTSVLMVGQFYLERYFGRGFDDRAPSRSRQKNINRAKTTPKDPLPQVEL